MVDFKKWTKIKQKTCEKIIEKMGKDRVGDQFYKKYWLMNFVFKNTFFIIIIKQDLSFLNLNIIFLYYSLKNQKMKLKRFLLRYYPPGIILEYVKKNGEIETKSIDLLNLSSEYFPTQRVRFTIFN